jgi:predicted ATPase
LGTVGRTAFVGREAVLARLREAWGRVCAGKREAVFLAGEPGIGKTRAAAEFVNALHTEGATVLFGRSDEDALLAFQPFVEALRHYVREMEAHELREQVTLAGPELAILVPDLARRLPGLAEPLHGDAEGERYRLFEAVATLLTVASSAAPLVLVLDDLHWADKPSLLLLKHILRSPMQGRILVLGTYRETELSRTHPLAEVMADLRREHLFERISLDGLNEANVATMVASMAGRGAPSEVTRAVHAETDGNPFFVEEVLRHLQESGALAGRDGQWVSSLSVQEIGIPEGVREVVGRRLNRLSDGCNQMLAIAAVVGRQFEFKVMERVTGLAGDQLFELIDECVQARVVEEVPGAVDHYTFAHALIRQVLYEELSAGRRLRLHRQIGLALEARSEAGAQVNVADLARHFLAAAPAGETMRAISYAARAAALNTRQAAHE